MTDGHEPSEQPVLPDPIAGRYEVVQVLGRGGTATAYHVVDSNTQVHLALKLLGLGRHGDGALVELFEREFHTLNQLEHPRVVRAFDYGFDNEGRAFYTMELLDGGDLRALAPIPWQTVCSIAYEVCSALSLLHSRRLVHRDLSPRNVRLTSDGKAKLIDFGLLSPFGVSTLVAGTPPHVAPELLNSMGLDGRSDLFSLGATLYYALTGRSAFPARRFEQLRDLWRTTPISPARLVDGIPAALDRLVMALLRIDMGSRPKSATEVMAQLRPLLSAPPDDALCAAGAYLTAPKLIGRGDALVCIRKQVIRATRGHGGGFLISGNPGSGRTRMLDIFVLETKLLGAASARAGADDAAAGPFGAAQKLLVELHENATKQSLQVARSDPQVANVLFGVDTPSDDQKPRNLVGSSVPRAEMQSALRTWIRRIAERQLVAIVVDDFETIDEPSAALLASLTLELSGHTLIYAFATQCDRLGDSAQPLQIIRQQSHPLALPPLSANQTAQLLSGVFGDVPNLQGLTAMLHGRSHGLPGQCLQLAQILVDQEVITYREGGWQIPTQLPEEALPSQVTSALRRSVETLSEATMLVGRLLALSVLPQLSRSQIACATGLSAAEVARASDELRQHDLVAGSGSIALADQQAAELFLRGITVEQRKALHDTLAQLHHHAGRSVLLVTFHAIQGSDPHRALANLNVRIHSTAEGTSQVRSTYDEIGSEKTAEAVALCRAAAAELNCDEKHCFRLWSMQAGIAAGGERTAGFYEVAPQWLAQLKKLSGFDDWHTLPPSENPQERSLKALLVATERFQNLPEAERTIPPQEAITGLTAYVVFSIAVGSRMLDLPLLESITSLLVPFAPLNPLVAAMARNAEATLCLAIGQEERSRQMFMELSEELEHTESPELGFLEQIRSAISIAIGNSSAALGIPSDPKWLPTNDGFQVVSVEYLHKIAALHRGDWQAAEAHRQKAELLALQNRIGTMFTKLQFELEAHALARDLTGLQAVRERIAAMAREGDGWIAVRCAADACHHFLRGELDAALQAVHSARQSPGVRTSSGQYRVVSLVDMIEVESLLAQGQVDEARKQGRSRLDELRAGERHHHARLLALSVALAEAHGGDFAKAQTILAEVASEQQALEICGVLRGRCAEYRARVALLARDVAVFTAAAEDAARDYLAVPGSVLGALHAQLIEDAQQAGLIATGQHANGSHSDQQLTFETHVKTTLYETSDANSRARAALSLLCDGDCPRTGYLFLLTQQGLTLCAASGGRMDSDELQTFAQNQVDMELDDDVCTMVTESEEVEPGTMTTQVTDHKGVHYSPVPLISHSESGMYVVGVALLSHTDAPQQHASNVVHLVAKYLIDSGDYAPVVAA